MADELNTPNHRYYQNRYNVELAPNEMSKQWILASGIARIDNAAVLPLFASAEPGTWYDPSDLNTLFTDTAGATPITTPGQTVGLMLDKSQGLVIGPELVTNGTFDTDTDWTKSGTTITGGALVFSGTAEASVTQPSVFIANQIYEMVLDIATATAGTLLILSGTGQTMTSASFTTSGIKRIKLRPQTTGTLIIYTNTSFVGTVNSISIKLLAGNHAAQPTSAQRPTYGINPIVGTRNLLTYTEQFDNAVWNALSGALVITPNTVAAPDGTMTADSVALANGFKLQALTVSVGVSYTFSVYLRTDTGTKNVQLREANGSGEKTVTVTTEWQRFTLGYDSINATNYLGIDQRSGTSPSQSGTLYIWGAQLEASATATAYQKVVTQYEVTEAGVQSAGYLRFDGVDDGMVTSTITPGIDKVQVFAGVRKLVDGAYLTIAEFSVNWSSNSGTFVFSTNNGSGYLFGSKGTSGFSSATGTGSAPTTNVLACFGDISAPRVSMRVNGGTANVTTSSQGTGNYLAYPIYIGRRAGTSTPINMRLYSLITRFGANLTDGQIASTESWVNAKTRAY